MRSIEEINAAFVADMVDLRDRVVEDAAFRDLAPEGVDKYIANQMHRLLEKRGKRLVALAAEVEEEPR